jgi:hypothetical protein
LFFLIYCSACLKLKHAGIRPTETVPCPYCNNEIPIESKVCPYCGINFEEPPDAKFDIRLRMDLPKQKSNLPHGYTPVKCPTEEENKRLF